MKRLWQLALVLLAATPLGAQETAFPRGTTNGATGGGHTIQDEGSSLAQRTTLNFTGAGVTCTDGSGKTNCDVPGPSSATSLDQAGAEQDMVYDSTANVYHNSTDGDANWDQGERSIGNTLGNTYANRVRVCYPEDYDRDGTSTTDGIQECIAALQATGGGRVVLGGRTYNLSGSAAIVIDSSDAACLTAACEIDIVGSSRGGTVIDCQSGNSCTASAIIQIGRFDAGGATASQSTIQDVLLSTNQNNVDGIQCDDVTGVTIRGVHIDGNSSAVAGSRTARGIYNRGCQLMTVDAVRVRFMQYGIYFDESTDGTEAVGNVRLIGFHNSSVDYGTGNSVTGGAGNDNATVQNIDCQNCTFQTMALGGIVATAGDGDTYGRATVTAINSRFEGIAAGYGISVIGSAGDQSPMVMSLGNIYASITSGYGINADANSNGDIISQGDWVNSAQCIRHQGSGNIYFNSPVTQASGPCTPTASTGSLRRNTEIGWLDEAITLTADWKAITASANDNDTSLATTAYVQTELTAYASDTKTFTNTTITGGGQHDLGGATSFEVPNGADPITDIFGELAADNDAWAASRGALEHYDGTASTFVVATLASDVPSNGQVPVWNTGGTITWENQSGGGTGAFSDAGDPVVLNTTTKDVVIGTSQVNSSKLTIDGDADQVQLTVQANATQTDSAVIVENSGGTEVFNVNADGAVYAQSIGDIDGPNTNWSIDTAGNATFASIATAASATPTIGMTDSTNSDADVDFQIAITDNASNDTQADLQVEIAGTLTTYLRLDGLNNNIVLGAADVTDITLTTDGTGTGEVVLPNDSIGDAEVVDTLTASNYLPLAGGTLTGEATVDDLGLEFTPGDTLTNCSTFAATGGGIYYDDSEGKFKKCQENVLTDLDTSGSSPTFDTIGSGSNTTATMTVGTGASFAPTGSGTVTANVVDAVGAAGITIGSADVTAVTFTTDGTGDAEVALPAGSIGSAEIDTIVQSMYWGAGAFSTDGAQCAAPAEVTLNSGPKLYTVLCADNDASTIWGSTTMPDSWDGGTVTFELVYVQTAADTAALNSDIAAACRGAGETVNSTLGAEVAIDDAAVSGSNIVDHTTSAAVTPDGTCAGGDTLYWRWQLDATGTVTAVGTLHVLGAKMEYTSTVGD